ncbi:MAG TPA: hypothetical protein VJR89_20250 [Polyangiales bacterium]|nr:hypothetical protein [Polyangiales bacterium]
MTARGGSWLYLAMWFGVLLSLAPRARAEEEAPDATRLDVERLPPEALQVTRDMYSQGLFLRSEMGGQGFAGGIGRLSAPGPMAKLVVGYELASWFSVASQLGLAFHATHAPTPPAATAFQLYSLLAQARFQANLGTRAALWLSGDAGAGFASGDFLQAFGYEDAGKIGLIYGGTLGFDWHLFNAHHSLGLAAGAHLWPNLNDPDGGEQSIGIDATAYLKYVF